MRPALLASLLLGASCGTTVAGPSSTGPHLSAGPATPAVAPGAPVPTASSPQAARPTPPAGFPVYPGASPAPLPADDAGVAGRWTTGDLGAAPYDFYSEALPAAGFAVVGSYPGGAGAVIVFGAGGRAWQVAISPDGDRMLLSLELNRP